MEYRARVRLLFAVLPVFMVGGFVLALAGLEPYPALVFPAFEQAGEGRGEIAFEKPGIHVWSGGRRTVLSTHDLLDGLPESYHATVLMNRFRHPHGTGRPVQRVEATLGGRTYVVERLARAWDTATEAAFRDHLLEMAGGSADSLVVTWKRHRRSRDGTWTAEPLPDRLVFDFTDLRDPPR